MYKIGNLSCETVQVDFVRPSEFNDGKHIVRLSQVVTEQYQSKANSGNNFGSLISEEHTTGTKKTTRSVLLSLGNIKDAKKFQKDLQVKLDKSETAFIRMVQSYNPIFGDNADKLDESMKDRIANRQLVCFEDNGVTKVYVEPGTNAVVYREYYFDADGGVDEDLRKDEDYSEQMLCSDAADYLALNA